MKVLVQFARSAVAFIGPVAFTLMIFPVGADRAEANAPDNSAWHASEHGGDQIEQRSMALERAMRNSIRIDDPFGPTAPSPEGPISFKWRELQSRLEIEKRALATCLQGKEFCSAAATEFLNIVELARRREGRSMFGEINRAVNLAIRSMSDARQYGFSDWWAGPVEVFERKAGDCEDYAIAKYMALRSAGVALENVRLVLVRDLKRQIDHAVVTVLFGSQWLILDNRTFTMVDAREALHYLPLVVMDDRGVRQFTEAY